MNLSIKNVPDHIVSRLRERARRQHRSLQGELLAIIESATNDDQPSTPSEVLAEVRELGLQTQGEAASILRSDRDSREHRSIADIVERAVERALESYGVRETGREPASAFYTRLSNDHGSDVDLEKIIQGSRQNNVGPDL